MAPPKVLQFPKPRRPAPDRALDQQIAAHQRKHAGRLSMMCVKPGDMAARLSNRTTHRATRAL